MPLVLGGEYGKLLVPHSLPIEEHNVGEKQDL